VASKKYKNKTCVYCRNALSCTADHVFPREIFLKHQRNLLPKVPSCSRCNGEKSKLEHYLLSVLPFGATHSHAHQAISVDVKRRLEKNTKLHNKLRREYGYGYAPGQGKILEKTLSLKFDGEILHKFISFVGLGLLWHHWEKCLPLDCSFYTFTPSPTGMNLVSKLFNFQTPYRVNVKLGGNTVRYKGVMSDKDECMSVWAVQLLGGITISTLNQSHIFKNSFVTMITGSQNIINKLNKENAI